MGPLKRWGHVLFGLATLSITLPVSAQQQTTARYGLAIEAELQAMGIKAACEQPDPKSYRCTYKGRSSLTERKLQVIVVYSDRTDSVYFYVERYLQAPPGGPNTEALLRRLMELNWELLVGKFEWNARSGEVRLGAVLNTDSNFDRRSFRSIVTTLDTLAARYHRELSSLLAN